MIFAKKQVVADPAELLAPVDCREVEPRHLQWVAGLPKLLGGPTALEGELQQPLVHARPIAHINGIQLDLLTSKTWPKTAAFGRFKTRTLRHQAT